MTTGSLSPAELTELGHQLYELLAAFHGYVTARVGWHPEPFLDPAEIRHWSEELNDGSRLRGLPARLPLDPLSRQVAGRPRGGPAGPASRHPRWAARRIGAFAAPYPAYPPSRWTNSKKTWPTVAV